MADDADTSNSGGNMRGALLERGSRFLANQWRSMQHPTSNKNNAVDQSANATRVLEFCHPYELQQKLGLSICNEADSDDDLIKLLSTVAKYSLQNSPHNYINMWHGVDEPGLLGSWFTDTFNTQAFTYEVAPAFSLIENFLIEHIGVELIGYKRDKVDGTMCPGASLATMYALSLARHAKRPNTQAEGLAQSTPGSDKYSGQLVAFTSIESHFSIKKGMFFMGFGSANLIVIKCDKQGRMLPEALETAVKNCLAGGNTPFFVNATSGTTVLGGFDQLAIIAEICRKYQMWLHCDAAWGGAALVVPRLRATLLRDIEQCDSVVWNPHKMLCLPNQCSVFITRHRGALAAAHLTQASYLFRGDEFYDTSYDKVIQCDRHVDAFKLYLKWRALGTFGLQSEVEQAFAMAALLAELTEEHENFELVLPYSQEQCTNVCFWYVPPALRLKWKLAAKKGVRNAVNQERTKSSTRDDGEREMGPFESELNAIAPELKKRMMVEGTLMCSFQPSETLNLPNFFRMLIRCVPRQTAADMKFVVNEFDRLGQTINIKNSL